MAPQTDPSTPPPAWSDAVTPIEELRAALRRFNAERDWGQYHSPRNLAMALSVEVGELLELYLWCADGGPQPAVHTRGPRVAEEAADVAICLLNFCNQADIDLSAAVQAKLAANAQRYPAGVVRGRMEKHDEY